MELMKLTSNVKQIQDDVLKEILTLNANTEYLRGYLHGAYDKELFKKNVPVVSYDDVKPYIERVANGEPSNVISGKPITRFLLRYLLSSSRKYQIWRSKMYIFILELASYIYKLNCNMVVTLFICVALELLEGNRRYSLLTTSSLRTWHLSSLYAHPLYQSNFLSNIYIMFF